MKVVRNGPNIIRTAFAAVHEGICDHIFKITHFTSRTRAGRNPGEVVKQTNRRKRVNLLRKWKTLSHAFVSGLGTLATDELLKDPTEFGVDEREYGEVPHRPGHEDNAAKE